jgi:hypothetical protein
VHDASDVRRRRHDERVRRQRAHVRHPLQLGQLQRVSARHARIERRTQLDLLERQLRQLHQHAGVRAGRGRLSVGHRLDRRRSV